MNTTERLVIAVEKGIKKKFFEMVKKDGTTATYLIRKFLTDYTTKGTKNGRKTEAAKTTS